ncbi:MAG: CvpA family protein [Rhodocyclaceae bacterium]|jgi:membrane protein required for colicin V production|nr:CvpA family protein [Rhodocyclaceae bacterium]
MTGFDYAFLGLTGLMALLGFWRGLVSEVLALLAWVLAFLLARTFADEVGALFGSLIPDGLGRLVVGFLLIFVAVLMATGILRFLLRELLKVAGLGFADRFLGGCFGLLKGLFIALVLVMLGGMAGLAKATWWQGARFAPPLETAVIAAKPWLPEAIAKRIRF